MNDWDNLIPEQVAERQLKAGVRKSPTSHVGHWEGVLRDGKGNVVWVCGHLHKARDIDMRGFGLSARSCACEAMKRS